MTVQALRSEVTRLAAQQGTSITRVETRIGPTVYASHYLTRRLDGGEIILDRGANYPCPAMDVIHAEQQVILHAWPLDEEPK